MGSEAVQRGGCVIASEMGIPVDLIEGSVQESHGSGATRLHVSGFTGGSVGERLASEWT